MNVIAGENLYNLAKRDNFFIQSLAKVIKSTNQNAVIVTSYRNFYNAVTTTLSHGEVMPMKKDAASF